MSYADPSGQALDLELVKSTDITKHILPQVHFEKKIYREYLEPMRHIKYMRFLFAYP